MATGSLSGLTIHLHPVTLCKNPDDEIDSLPMSSRSNGEPSSPTAPTVVGRVGSLWHQALKNAATASPEVHRDSPRPTPLLALSPLPVEDPAALSSERLLEPEGLKIVWEAIANNKGIVRYFSFLSNKQKYKVLEQIVEKYRFEECGIAIFKHWPQFGLGHNGKSGFFWWCFSMGKDITHLYRLAPATGRIDSPINPSRSTIFIEDAIPADLCNFILSNFEACLDKEDSNRFWDPFLGDYDKLAVPEARGTQEQLIVSLSRLSYEQTLERLEKIVRVMQPNRDDAHIKNCMDFIIKLIGDKPA